MEAPEEAAAAALDEVRPGRGRCAVALRALSEGEVALTEAQVAWVMLPSRAKTRCSRCAVPADWWCWY